MVHTYFGYCVQVTCNYYHNNLLALAISWPIFLQLGSFDSLNTLMKYLIDFGSTFTLVETALMIFEAFP